MTPSTQPKAPLSRTLFTGWDILVVEDDADSRDIVVRTLTFCGGTTHIALHGQEGLTVLKTLRPRFVLSDLAMPIMTGWEMLEQMKRDPELQAIPVFALTAHALFEDRERALATGFYGFFTKPLTASSLIRDLTDSLRTIPHLAALLSP